MRPKHGGGGLVVALGFAVVCAFVVASWPAGVHWSPDCAAKVLQLGTLGSEHYELPYLGKTWDPELRFVPLGAQYYAVKGGALRMAWPYVFPMAVAPLYRAAGWFGLFVLPILCGAIAVFLTGRIADRIRPGTGFVAALVVAATTPVFIYSTLFWEHTPALALMLLAVDQMVARVADRRPIRAAIAAGALGLTAAGIRGDAVLLLAALFGAAFVLERGPERVRLTAWSALGFVVGSAPAWALNMKTSGGPLPNNAVLNTPPPSLTYLRDVKLGILPHFLAGKTVAPDLAWTLALAATVLVLAYYLRGRWAAYLLLAAAVVLALVSTDILDKTRLTRVPWFHGWLAMSPALVMGFLEPSGRTVEPPERSARELVLVTAVAFGVLNLFAITVTYPNGFSGEGNLEWGPRYWLALFPLMAVLVAVNVDAVARMDAPIAIRVGIAASFAVMLSVGLDFQRYGVTHLREGLESAVSIRSALEHAGDETLVEDEFWLAALSPDQFLRRPSVLVPRWEPARFGPWLEYAAAHGLSSFVLATFQDAPHPFLSTPLTCGCRLEVQNTETSGALKLIHVRVIPES